MSLILILCRIGYHNDCRMGYHNDVINPTIICRIGYIAVSWKLFTNIAVTASGLAAAKTLMLPSVWGQGAMPLLTQNPKDDDVSYDASPFQFERTLLGDVVKYSTSKKFVPQAIPAVVLGANTPFGNICWKE